MIYFDQRGSGRSVRDPEDRIGASGCNIFRALEGKEIKSCQHRKQVLPLRADHALEQGTKIGSA